MKKKLSALDDQALVDACVARASSGSAFVDSNLQAERREVALYYKGDKPFPLREGGSRFVSQDVYLAVEAVKSQLTEAFAAGNNIVEFTPRGPDDEPLAEQATAYCGLVINALNPGMEVFKGVIHDSSMNRLGVAQAYWDRREVTTSFVFSDIPPEQAQQLLQDPEVRLTSKPKAKQNPDGTMLVSGEFDRVEDTSQVAIENVPPEEFIVSGRFTDLSKAPYCARRQRVTLGDLVDEGFDPDIIYSLEGLDDDLAMDQERMERDEDTRPSAGVFDEDSHDEAGRVVTRYESYIRIDAEGTGRQQLWQVIHVGSTLLHKKRVADHPFVTYALMPEPHTFYGGNYAKRTVQHANVKTTLTRAIIEQAVDATNPRWQVARGGVANPRELIDNRRGGIVNVRDVGTSVAPLPQTPINPFVLQTIGMVDQDREDTTGISRLSQGLDKGALSHQNSSGLVEQLTSNSQVRQKVMARHFAVQFLVPLYLKVYALGIEHDRQRMLRVNGNYVEVTPQAWRARTDVQVDMTLGYDERDKAAEELLTYDRYMMETHPRLYDENKQFFVIKKVLKMKGHANVQDFVLDPSTLEPPAPDPKAAAELKKLEKEIEVAERGMALKEQTGEHARMLAEAEMKLKAESQTFTNGIQSRDAYRKDAETTNRIDIAQAELELALHLAMSAPEANTKSSAIISPNS